MIYCSNCRQTNDEGTNFCRSCGHRLALPQTQQNSDDFNSPRPYMWKTDEYQINPPQQKTQPIKQFANVPPAYNQQALGQVQNSNVVTGYRCPRCGTHNLPYVTRQISTAGWITFAVLLVTTFIFFWIGLLLKEDVRVCPMCGYKFH